MNKKDLVKAVAEDCGLTIKASESVVDAILNQIVDSVAAGEKVSLPGFGIFDRKERAARTGKNPRTNEPVEIPASTVPTFKAGKNFKQQVNS